jgi:hypothetical protein
MERSPHVKWLTRTPRARRFAAAALVSGVLLAGCGGGSAGPSAASVATTTSTTPRAPSARPSGVATPSRSSTATGRGGVSSGRPTQGGLESDELAYSRCMRANGVAAFPDPRAGGGTELQTGSGIDPSSAAFKAAQAKCQKIVPGLGGGPGSGPPPSARAMAAMLKVAQCMRRHGVADFPDPRTTVPSDPLAALGGSGVISDIDGVIFLFPSTVDEQSPLFTRAAATCNFSLHNH